MKEDEKIVYFVRHGQSEHNIAPVFQSPDSPLSERGREQAVLIADRAKNLNFETLISSPWQRAKETASYISKATGKEPEYSELFVERIKPSRINGKPHADQEADALWREWEKSLYTEGMKVEDGENFRNLVDRADKGIKFLEDKSEKSMLVVTHGFIMCVILARIIMEDKLTAEVFEKFKRSTWMQNTGITALRLTSAFEEQPRWRLWIFNDHAHLG